MQTDRLTPYPAALQRPLTTWRFGLPLLGLLLALLLTFSVASLLAPRAYYPHMVIEAEGAIQLSFLQEGKREADQCRRQLASMAEATLAACPTCTVSRSQCLENLAAEHLAWLSASPLDQPSTRTQGGVALYRAESAESALAACQLTAAHTQALPPAQRAECFPPDTARAGYERATPPSSLYPLAQAGLLGLCALLAACLVAGKGSASRPGPHANSWYTKLALAGTDALVLAASFAATALSVTLDDRAILTHAGLTLITVGWFWIVREHYSRRRPFWDELREIYATLAVVFLLASTTALYAQLDASPLLTLWQWITAFALLPLGRTCIKALLSQAGIWQRPAIIVGTGENAKEAWLAIRNEHNLGYQITAFAAPPCATDTPRHIQAGNDALPVVQLTENLAESLAQLGNPQVIVGLDSLAPAENQRLVQQLTAIQPNLHLIPAIRGLPLFGTQLSHFFSHEVLFLTVRNNLARRSYRWTKRAFDIVAASALLLILSPLMAYVAWRIWREDGAPVIFKQARIGMHSRAFDFFKFRSMVRNADHVLEQWREKNSPEWQRYYANNFKLADDPRVLSLGRWIRATSIDELPQLFNVLRGDMSLVGPRPLLARELPEYGNAISLYQQSRPGLTGLWQISGRSTTTFQDRANLDAWYVQNWSLWYDIAILCKTVSVVLQRQGAH